MTSSDLFAFGVSSLRLQAQPSQVELAEALSDTPPFKLTVEEVDRMAALQHEEITESRQHHNTRLQRHE